MSEEDRDIDVESDDVPDVGVEATASTSNSMDFEEDGLDKRAHHNALERRRRDHIKDSFHGLRDTIPSLHGEKVSRAHILNKATEYIRQLQKGGAVREGEIHDLKKKNEILEEQVQAMEQAKTLGNVENAEEILQMVVERVQARQRQHLQQQQQTKVANNQHSRRVDKSSEGNRDSNQLPDHTPLTSRSPTIAGSTDNRAAKEGANPLLPNSINLLASNLKSAQSLLTALQKNLPANANLPANVKSLAARVLASPFRQQGNSTAHPQTVPRGIVTATTMPKGTPLPTTLASALQQQQQPRSQGTPHTGMATGNTSPAPATQLMPTIPTAPIVPTSTSKVDSVAVPMSVQSVSKGSPTVIPRSTTVSMPHLSPSLLSQASSLSSQLLAANSLLQQGSAGRPGSGIAASPQLTPELIAQVSSFLNLPAAGASKPSSAEGLKVTAPIPSDTSTVMTTATAATSGDGLEVVGTHTSATVSTVATISTAAGAGGQCSMEGSQDGNAISSATDKPSPLKRGPPETTSETAAKKARVEL